MLINLLFHNLKFNSIIFEINQNFGIQPTQDKEDDGGHTFFLFSSTYEIPADDYF